MVNEKMSLTSILYARSSFFILFSTMSASMLHHAIVSMLVFVDHGLPSFSVLCVILISPFIIHCAASHFIIPLMIIPHGNHIALSPFPATHVLNGCFNVGMDRMWYWSSLIE